MLLLGAAAVGGRGSDPVLVERVGRLAFEGCRVGLADPVGVYIQAVELGRSGRVTARLLRRNGVRLVNRRKVDPVEAERDKSVLILA